MLTVPKMMLTAESGWRGVTLALIVASLALAVGCQNERGETADVQVRLSRLGRLYGMYLGAHGGKPAASLEAFKAFVQERVGDEQLQQLGLASFDDLFVSPRDGAPFIAILKVSSAPPAIDEPPAIVFCEAIGLDGEIAVGYLGGGTELLDSAELEAQLIKPSR
jgi:hypothetical protein